MNRETKASRLSSELRTQTSPDLRRRRGMVSLSMLGYAVATIVGWVMYGKPNPNGLGYTSKAIEAVLIAILALYTWRTTRATPKVSA